MAALSEICDEKLSSPSTVNTEYFEKSRDYDCEVAAEADTPVKRSFSRLDPNCGYGAYYTTGTWRTRFGFKQPNYNDDTSETFTRVVEDCPNGYPRLSAFLSSDHSFSCYRGFGYLHSRVLLGLQDKIVALERELDEKDDDDHKCDRGNRLKSRARDAQIARREDEERSRDDILEDIREALVKYDEMLVKSRDLVAFQKPSNRDYESVRNWFGNNKPLVEKEQAFVKHREDVVTLHSGREWSGFDGAIESLLLKFDSKLIRWIFLTPELRTKTRDKEVHYYTRSRVDTFVGLIITTIIFILLVLPVVAMYKLTAMGASTQSTFNAIGVLVVFTLLFSAAMSLLTKARRHELFAASAAYCAVLVVFISNFSGPG